MQSRLVVKVGPFCRKGLSPQGEPLWVAHPFHVAAQPSFRPRLVAGRGVAAKSCSASRTYRNRRLHPAPPSHSHMFTPPVLRRMIGA